jgi:hypothetical protein
MLYPYERNLFIIHEKSLYVDMSRIFAGGGVFEINLKIPTIKVMSGASFDLFETLIVSNILVVRITWVLRSAVQSITLYTFIFNFTFVPKPPLRKDDLKILSKCAGSVFFGIQHSNYPVSCLFPSFRMSILVLF